jgi:paraquat-inducible protein A
MVTTELTPDFAADGLSCRICGFEHRRVALRPGQRAICVRCGALIVKRNWFGPDAALAFSVTGLVLAIPAILLPFVTVSKLRAEHVTYLFTGVSALWNDGMRLLAIWVFLCGTVAPALLLSVFLGLLLPAKFSRQGARGRFLWRAVHALQHWAMPEVHVLAVLVSLTKLGSLVDVSVGPGFWSYVAMTFTILFAWGSFDFDLQSRRAVSGPVTLATA